MKPPWSWVRVVLACPTIRDLDKLVAVQTYSLIPKSGGGAEISSEGLAQRLGRGHASIERARARLKRWGLLESRYVNGRTALWFIHLPADCQPRGSRPKDYQVRGLALELAKRIEGNGAAE